MNQKDNRFLVFISNIRDGFMEGYRTAYCLEAKKEKVN